MMIMHNAARTRLIERLKGAERIMQVLEGHFQTERREKKKKNWKEACPDHWG